MVEHCPVGKFRLAAGAVLHVTDLFQSIFRRSGCRFGVENATNKESRARSDSDRALGLTMAGEPNLRQSLVAGGAAIMLLVNFHVKAGDLAVAQGAVRPLGGRGRLGGACSPDARLL